jgi:hypothetical protein
MTTNRIAVRGIVLGVCLDMSGASGLISGQSNRGRNFEKANIEYRIMNIECRRNVFCRFKKRLSAAIQSFEIRYSIFCGSAVRCSAQPLA